jgi:hypothetical protein
MEIIAYDGITGKVDLHNLTEDAIYGSHKDALKMVTTGDWSLALSRTPGRWAEFGRGSALKRIAAGLKDPNGPPMADNFPTWATSAWKGNIFGQMVSIIPI